MDEQQRLAIHRARELNIDQAVRTVAKERYYNHSNHINYYARFEKLHISATFGAGTNSAVVSIDDGSNMATEENTLYRATNYGHFISVFKYGPWVHRLIAEAERLEALAEVEKQVARIVDERRRAANYEEVDF